VQRLTYSSFRLWEIVPDDLDSAAFDTFPFSDGAQFRAVGTTINEPAAMLVYEDFVPGPAYQWTLWQDQIDLCLEGSAEITYWEPPDQIEPRKVIATAPCVYLIPRGTRIEWRVLGETRFRHVSIDFPNPGFTVSLPPRLSGADDRA
jgi:hypothetical protein